MPIILLIHVYPVKILIIPKNVKRSPPPRMTSSERRFYYEKLRREKQSTQLSSLHPHFSAILPDFSMNSANLLSILVPFCYFMLSMTVFASASLSALTEYLYPSFTNMK